MNLSGFIFVGSTFLSTSFKAITPSAIFIFFIFFFDKGENLYHYINYEEQKKDKQKSLAIYFCKHFRRKSFASKERCSGMGGCDFVFPIWSKAAT